MYVAFNGVFRPQGKECRVRRDPPSRGRLREARGDGAPAGADLSLTLLTMRPSRSLVLSQPTGITHVMWRCHNKERLLEAPEYKHLYLQSLIFGLDHKSTDESVRLHCFAVMDNHTHQQMSYQNGSQTLSDFMRIANSRFGSHFNRRKKRSGKVANERPKTSLVGNVASEMRVHFYVEANPIRAGITQLEKLRYLPWNSYRYYAYGIVDHYTRHLTPPQWYLDLGRTPIERQRAYRKLFKDYLEQSLSPWRQFLKRFIGAPDWIFEKEQAIKSALKARNEPQSAMTRSGLKASPPE